MQAVAQPVRARSRQPPRTTTRHSATRPALLDVAQAAGVSTMTVVRVLRDPDKVAAETRARVERVLRETGYTPDLVARGLASQSLGPGRRHHSRADQLADRRDHAGPHRRARAGGAAPADRRQRILGREEEVLVRAFLSRRVDAIYLTGVIHTGADRAHARATPASRSSRAAISPTTPIDMVVGYSNVDAARAVTRHLLERGYWPIGYIGAFPEDNDRARDRRRGYESALRTARRRVDASLCVETTLDLDAGAHAMATLLDAASRDVRAVFCSADAIAVGALFECQRRGLAIPGRIAIAGFDDIPIAGQVVPALTTLRVPRYDDRPAGGRDDPRASRGPRGGPADRRYRLHAGAPRQRLRTL